MQLQQLQQRQLPHAAQHLRPVRALPLLLAAAGGLAAAAQRLAHKRADALHDFRLQAAAARQLMQPHQHAARRTLAGLRGREARGGSRHMDSSARATVVHRQAGTLLAEHDASRLGAGPSVDRAQPA